MIARKVEGIKMKYMDIAFRFRRSSGSYAILDSRGQTFSYHFNVSVLPIFQPSTMTNVLRGQLPDKNILASHYKCKNAFPFFQTTDRAYGNIVINKTQVDSLKRGKCSSTCIAIVLVGMREDNEKLSNYFSKSNRMTKISFII